MVEESALYLLLKNLFSSEEVDQDQAPLSRVSGVRMSVPSWNGNL